MKLWIQFILIVSFAMAAHAKDPVEGEPSYVYVNCNNTGELIRDGSTPNKGYRTIQEGVDAVNPSGGTVQVVAGTYGATTTRTVMGAPTLVSITDSITVKNYYGGTVIIDAQGMARGVYMTDGTLDGISVLYGYAPNLSADGGGIWAQNSTIQNCTIAHCSARYAGGVWLDHAELKDCVVQENQATSYAGIAGFSQSLMDGCSVVSNESYAAVGGAYASSSVITNSVIRGNEAGSSAGGLRVLGTGTIVDCVIEDNLSDGNCGGVDLLGGGVSRCRVMNNQAGSQGGGVYFSGGSLANCLIAENTATSGGGGVYAVGGSGITNCTITANAVAVGYGAGLYVEQAVFPVVNTILYDNEGDDYEVDLIPNGGITTAEVFAELDHVCVPGNALDGINGCFDHTPNLNADYTLPQASPCVGAGNDARAAGTIDLAGATRIQVEAVDVGCYESSYWAQQAIVYADAEDGDDANQGTFSSPRKTAQLAVEQCSDDGAVYLYGGTYDVGGDVSPVTGSVHSNRVVLTRGVTLQGILDEWPVISGGGVMRGVYLGRDCTLKSLIVRNGAAALSSSVSEDLAAGGVYAYSATIDYCRVDTCQGNGSSGTAGISAYLSEVNRCYVADCSSGGQAVSLTSSTLSNSLIYDNVMLGVSSVGNMVSGCTIVNNTGGQLNLYSGTAANCIIDGTALPNLYVGSSATISNSCSPDGLTHGVDGCITNDPLFVGFVQLDETSPCVNAGDNSAVYGSEDLFGDARIQSAVVDMGCHETPYARGVLDADSDGMADAWETTWFDTIGDCVATNHDDGDIFNNLEEYIAGTCPTNTDSAFLITNQLAVANGFELQWDAVSGRVYSVEWADCLTNSFQPLENLSNLTASPCVVSNGLSQGYFRLKVGLE